MSNKFLFSVLIGASIAAIIYNFYEDAKAGTQKLIKKTKDSAALNKLGDQISNIKDKVAGTVS